DVRATADGDEDAVEGVVGERDEDQSPLEEADERQPIEKFDLLGVGEGAVDGLEVGDDVLNKEGTDGHDAGERMQPAPEEGVSLASAKRLHTAQRRRGRWGWRSGCCHSETPYRSWECCVCGFSAAG